MIGFKQIESFDHTSTTLWTTSKTWAYAISPGCWLGACWWRLDAADDARRFHEQLPYDDAAHSTGIITPGLVLLGCDIPGHPTSGATFGYGYNKAQSKET
jgi:hypothetical protein